MLKRIAVVTEADGLLKRVVDAIQDEDIDVALVAPGGELPPGAAALISDTSVFDAAIILAQRQADCYLELIELVGFAICAREQYLEGAVERNMDHATRFAKALALNPNDQMALERGAAVKDIGKLRISNEVLLKKSVLTYDEWILLQSHTNLGADMLKGISALRDVEDIVRHHHECFDGTGYPNGIEGDHIPILAQATKILDVYCAMTSPRHYRQGYCTHEDALDYLRGEKGKHFHPELVQVFIDKEVGKPIHE